MKKILIINWRSLKDPLSGGAEVATMEHAKRWVNRHNAQVIWLSPKYDKKINRETVDGVHFEYIGMPLTRSIPQLLISFPLFYFLVFWTYARKYKGNIDVVIDEVHGIPYLTPLYVKEKIIVYIHEVAGEIWDLMYPFPINKIGHFLEKLVFMPYKKKIFVASQAAAKDLPSVGIPSSVVRSLDYGIVAPIIKEIPKKNKQLTIVYLNRLVKMKGPERAIDIFKNIHQNDPKAILIFIGKGDEEYLHFLKNKVINLKLQKNIIFKGFVTQTEKFRILGQAHVLLNSSYKEGWGLCNIEANRMGTPVVAFKVTGNSESVIEGKSGYLFSENELSLLVGKIILLKNDINIRKTALTYSYKFDWDKLSDEFYEIIDK